MEESRNREAQKIFGVPEEFYHEANIMVKESEWEMILLMGKDPVPEEELKEKVWEKRLACDPMDFIRECYHRAIIDKVPGEDGSLSWKISDFYGRYPYFAQFEYYEYSKFPREVKEALNRWDKEVYYEMYHEDIEKKMQGIDTHLHNSDFLTLEEALTYVEKHPEGCSLHACNCKAMMFYHDRPITVCLTFYKGPNGEYDRGHSTPMTAEEGKAKIREFNKKGLMQNGEDHTICNCDGYCCYPLANARRAGSRGFYPKSNYDIDWHEDECISCGKCTKICNFGAFQKNAEGKVEYHKDLCWGCTICAPNCPKGAIHLHRKPGSYSVVDKI